MLYVSIQLEPGPCTIRGRFLTRFLICSESVKIVGGKATWESAALVSSFFFFCLFNFLSVFPSSIHHSHRQLKQDDEVTTVQVKEQDRDVLVLKKVQSCGPAPQAGSAESDWRSEFPPSPVLPFPFPCLPPLLPLHLTRSLCLLFPPTSLPPFFLRLSELSVLADCRALSSQMDSVPSERTEMARSLSL